ncbi:hypothetical protein BO78DRAFT_465837 [Aspergillus sclerotiicarbonarius CBS 121057]|uniref:ABM domain-containing protein n=1 Tax=Aspergillus sclerotiicarbonarius (strain CBS 121057 / IBT 28362) TaxID=1448318 RepID=A0A319F3X0_ASPSB|nr:hypothetical protein BO78DRAFT_465837 [Aspergillus sclerotiicarbonarius CBS 121057]
MSGITEFIYFHLNPAIKPEDPTNEAGASLLELFQTIKHESGYKGSAWGRSIEDENVVVWVIDWKDAHPTPTPPPSTSLTPYLTPNKPLTTFFATLSPPLNLSSTSTTPSSKPPIPPSPITSPLTELFTPFFPTTLTPDETSSLHNSLISFRNELMHNLPEEQRPGSFSMGQVERPGTRTHGGSLSGEAFGMVVVVGWESLEAHLGVKGTEAFGRGIQPIRGWMLKGDGSREGEEGFGVMRHIAFREI